jgi:hypothetical protein
MAQKEKNAVMATPKVTKSAERTICIFSLPGCAAVCWFFLLDKAIEVNSDFPSFHAAFAL